MKYILSLIIFFLFLNGYAQSKTIDTIPFHLDKLLLVFKGKINGVETDFAFDTGASHSVSNTNVNSMAKISKSKGKKRVKDSNQNQTKIENVLIDELNIGNFHVTNLKALTYDMPFLNCANLFLLGADVINKLNWKFDFEKKLIYVSETPFETDATMQTWDIFYKSNTPRVRYSYNNKNFKSCLIDFGFNGILEVDAATDDITEIYRKQSTKNKVNEYITSNMSLTGLGTPIEANDFIIDTMYIHNTLIKGVKVSRKANTDDKIGVYFFNKYCKEVILNFSQNKFYLNLLNANNTVANKNPLDTRVSIKEGKFIITSKNISQNSTALQLNIDEEIKSVNGKLVSDFKDECEFLLWYYLYKNETLLIEKLNGEKITISRSTNINNTN